MDQLKQLFQSTLLVAYPLFQNIENNERIFNKWRGLCTLINSDVSYLEDPMYTSVSFKNLQIGYRIRNPKVLVLWKLLLK